MPSNPTTPGLLERVDIDPARNFACGLSLPANCAGHFRKSNHMIEVRKSDCEQTLVFGLTRTRDWRKKLATKYAVDPRNSKAVECLTVLAKAASTELTDSEWVLLQPHCSGWADERFREAISVAARAVGFTRKIQDFPSFIEHLLGVLEQPVAA